MRAYEFKNPIKEMKIVEVVPAINISGGRVGQPMGGAAHAAGHQAGQAATGGAGGNVQPDALFPQVHLIRVGGPDLAGQQGAGMFAQPRRRALQIQRGA